jgi:phosphatidate cytidylyltransferase
MKNMIIRTISGIIFIVIMLSGLLIDPLLFCIIFSFILCVMMYEYLNITINHRHKTASIISMITALSLFIGTFLIRGNYAPPSILFFMLPLFCSIFIILLYDKDKESYKIYPYLLSGILYIAIPLSSLNFLVFDTYSNFSGMILLSLFIIMWASDVGAYIFGISFGQKNGHKLFPSISPKKSWEGYIGSVFTSIAAAVLLSYFKVIPFNLIHSIIIALIINIFGTLGDLVESQLKRNFGVKDSGKIMPGHGGLLDRFDGVIISFPIAVCYIMLFNLI